jgi:hypothetical protein
MVSVVIIYVRVFFKSVSRRRTVDGIDDEACLVVIVCYGFHVTCV